MGHNSQPKQRKAENGNDAGGASVQKQRKPQVAWSQTDTERLCELLLEHARIGILSKRTDAQTNAKKAEEWETIAVHFNASPSVCIFYLFYVSFSHSHSLSLPQTIY